MINKNLKDSVTNTSISIKDIPPSISYTKTQKLITALYMVTDIIDREEPIRHKLRTLGLEILSDISNINSARAPLAGRIDEMMSFLDIASAMNFISEMNCAILTKEFLELKKSIQESTQIKPTWLEGFLSEPPLLDKEGVGGGNFGITTSPFGLSSSTRRRENSIGHKGHTRIGVQKGSTLLQALSKIGVSNRKDFNILKKQRRADIIDIIKNNGGNATIKDIIIKINTGTRNSLPYSEKTLQRELMSMTRDGVLNKTGEKRWSRYFVKN